MLQNHAWVKDQSKVQDRWMDFSVTENKKDSWVGFRLDITANL